MKKSPRVLIALASMVILAAGCKGATSIGKLLDNPGRYDKQTVRVAGTVGQTAGVLGYGAYRLDDGTGTITVVTQGGGAPREGAHVGVEGEFRSAFTLGPQSIAVVMEKRRFNP